MSFAQRGSPRHRYARLKDGLTEQLAIDSREFARAGGKITVHEDAATQTVSIKLGAPLPMARLAAMLQSVCVASFAARLRLTIARVVSPGITNRDALSQQTIVPLKNLLKEYVAGDLFEPDVSDDGAQPALAPLFTSLGQAVIDEINRGATASLFVRRNIVLGEVRLFGAKSAKQAAAAALNHFLVDGYVEDAATAAADTEAGNGDGGAAESKTAHGGATAARAGAGAGAGGDASTPAASTPRGHVWPALTNQQRIAQTLRTTSWVSLLDLGLTDFSALVSRTSGGLASVRDQCGAVSVRADYARRAVQVCVCGVLRFRTAPLSCAGPAGHF